MSVACVTLTKSQFDELVNGHEIEYLVLRTYRTNDTRAFIECEECGETVLQFDVEGHEDRED